MKIFSIVAVTVILGACMLGSCSNKRTKEVRSEMGVVVLPNGNRMYEVEFDNIEYVVIEKHKGIGITRK